MKDQILKLIQERDHVSFAELSRDIQGFSGNFEFFNSALKNVILWNNISEDGVEAMKYLLSNSKIFISETDPLVYLHDGFISPYPVATVTKSHKTTHWLPVEFSCTPPITSHQKP